MQTKELNQIIEGLLFLSGNEGITIGELIATTNVDQMSIEQAINNLREQYYRIDSNLTIIHTADTYKLVISNQFQEYYQKYVDTQFNDRLSKSALETLAIIAYNQPITRFNIEEKRGVMSDHCIRALVNRELIKIGSKSNEIGRPNLYVTTTQFLDFLGISDLKDLPPLEEFKLDIDVQSEGSLFNDYDDFNEIKKRLLTSDNIIKIEEDYHDDLDSVKIKEIDLQNNDEKEVND